MGSRRCAILTVITAAVLLAGCGSAPPVTAPSTEPPSREGLTQALWRLAASAPPSPTATSLALDVAWEGCTGGVAVKDPVPFVEYDEATLRIEVWGVAPAGDMFACPSNPTTTVLVPLTEPVGDRRIIGESLDPA